MQVGSEHVLLQSSVLALLLASKFFEDPLVRLTCGISVIVMTLVSEPTLSEPCEFALSIHFCL